MFQRVVKYIGDLLWTLQRIAMAQEARARLERHYAASNARGVLAATWTTEHQKAEARAILHELGMEP